MSEWQKHGIEAEVLKILQGQHAHHHFGRPFLPAYALAAELRDRKPGFMPHLPVGGEGTGAATGRESLARYIARELSARIKANKIPVEGAMLSNEHLHEVVFDHNGALIRSSLTDSGFTLSMFRLQEE